MASQAKCLEIAGTNCVPMLPEQVRELRVTASPRKVVDAENRPALGRERSAALEKLERFRWWNATSHFPGQPDELLQTVALKGWFAGFTLASAMMLAPVLACLAVLSFADAEPGMDFNVSTAVAIISLMVLVLVMQLFAKPLWGKTGDSGRLFRRVFLLSLPTPIIATNLWLAFPRGGIKAIGILIPLADLLLLIAMVAWFLVLYFRYTDCPESGALLSNRDPFDAVRSYYDLLTPVSSREARERNLETVAQYLLSFRGSRYLGECGEEYRGRWLWAPVDRPMSLRDVGGQVVKSLQSFITGDRLLDVRITESVFLRSAEESEATRVIACLALRYRATRGPVCASLAGRSEDDTDLSGVLHVCHAMTAEPDGWLLLNGSPAMLPADDVRKLRDCGLLS